jgi:hypothetical protein
MTTGAEEPINLRVLTLVAVMPNFDIGETPLPGEPNDTVFACAASGQRVTLLARWS